MWKGTSLRPSIAVGAGLTAFSLIALKIFLPESNPLGIIAAGATIGVAGVVGSNLLFSYFLEKARSSSEVAAERLQEAVDNLQRERSRLEAILGSMIEGVVAVDPQLHITFLNRSFANALEVRIPLEPRTPLVSVVRDHELLEMFNAVFASGEPIQGRLTLSASGARTFAVQVTPLADASTRGAIGMFYDITEIERLERIRKDFVANVSHELRTPLAAISGYAETLLEGALDDPDNSRRFAEIILNKARQLANIVSDLLVLSTLEGGKPPAPEPVSLRDSISSALRTVEPVAKARQVNLVFDNGEDEHVMGYEIRLEQVWVNLLDNAIKFNRPDGEVRVEMRREPDRAIVRVCDTGLGIPSRDLPRVFERFYRVDKARSRATGGTGLGLAIVKHAVEQMGGSVAVESRLGQGTTFTVVLPPLEAGNGTVKAASKP
ncbi:MAG TPA: ATP-binding protein [Bryobacteraceae bacterium]|nr:ATP-binding protein [Bryobacteraceae bacterium]